MTAMHADHAGGAGLIKALVVDDESLARARMRTLLADCHQPAVQCVGEAATAAEAVALLQHQTVDVAFLDIHMPGADGLTLARSLRAMEHAPALIFVTAHTEHAVHAFDLEAVDYLTKPVRRERLQAALQRVAQRLALQPAVTAPPAEADPVIVVTELGRVVRVPLREVLYLKAELKYVTLRTAEHTYVLDEALSDLQQRLGDRFLRVHRNALVARHALRTLERRMVAGEGADEPAEGWAVQVDPVDEWLTVSRRQVAAVREAMRETGGR